MHKTKRSGVDNPHELTAINMNYPNLPENGLRNKGLCAVWQGTSWEVGCHPMIWCRQGETARGHVLRTYLWLFKESSLCGRSPMLQRFPLSCVAAASLPPHCPAPQAMTLPPAALVPAPRPQLCLHGCCRHTQQAAWLQRSFSGLRLSSREVDVPKFRNRR